MGTLMGKLKGTCKDAVMCVQSALYLWLHPVVLGEFMPVKVPGAHIAEDVNTENTVDKTDSEKEEV